MAASTTRARFAKNGRRLGLRLDHHGRGEFIEGHEVHALIACSEPISPHKILVMKEAILDFALRREIPPPSWWADNTSVSPDAGVTTKDSSSIASSPMPAPSHVPSRRGRKAKKLDQVKAAMREDIQLGRQTPDSLRDMLEKGPSGQLQGQSRDRS
jgi:hypothetical protein